MNKIILSSSSSSFLSLFSRRKKLMTYSCFSHILPRCPQPCNTTENTSCYPHVSLFELRPEPILLSRSPAQIKRICYTTNSFFSKWYFFSIRAVILYECILFPSQRQTVDPMISRAYPSVREMDYTSKVHKSFDFYIKKNISFF